MSHQLPFSLTLRDPAVIGSLAEDPNRVTSQGWIPGSALLGAAAGDYIRNNGVASGQAHRDSTFRRWFLRGGLRFLNAYPHAHGHRFFPAPHSLQYAKRSEEDRYDLSREDHRERVREEQIALKPVRGHVRWDEDTVHVIHPKTRVRYHHYRPKDRRQARPTTDEGNLFLYEALEAGQTFGGCILGEEADLTGFVRQVGWGKGGQPLRFGRSRTAEYGANADLSLGEVKPFAREVGDPDAEFVGGDLVVTLLAPLIGVDSGGRPAAIFPESSFRDALRSQGILLGDLVAAFCRPVWVGGYSGIWNLPRPQSQALAAGSVFVWKVDGPSAPVSSRELERVSLGSRTAEGFGRFAVDWHTSSGTRALRKVIPASPRKPGGAPPALFAQIYGESRRRRREERASMTGQEKVTEVQGKERISPSQLGRLRHVLHSPGGLGRLKALLVDLRKPARDQMSEARLGSQTLLEHIQSVATDTNSIMPYIHVELPGVDGLEPDEPRDDELARLYLLALLTGIARAKRGGEPGGSDDE